jgi:hypothetical protein
MAMGVKYYLTIDSNCWDKKCFLGRLAFMEGTYLSISHWWTVDCGDKRFLEKMIYAYKPWEGGDAIEKKNKTT